MKGKHICRPFVAAGMLVALALLPGTPSSASPAHVARYAGGSFPFTKADYDSGWFSIEPAEAIALEHNLGGDTDDYVVDLAFLRPAGVHHLGYGTDSAGGTVKGAYWHHLDDTGIYVVRAKDDYLVYYARVRIWRVLQADYDSGWRTLSPSSCIGLSHNLGGDPDDYLVYLEYGSGLYAHQYAYGGDWDRDGAGELVGSGGCWQNLNDTEILLCRHKSDLVVPRARIRIWVVPHASYDSGWVAVGPGEIVRLEHALETTPTHYFVDLQFKGDLFTMGVNQACYGLDTCPSADGTLTYEYGATWYDLGYRYVRLTRGISDGSTASEVRLRLWVGHTVHLPLVLREW
jgi:hypothetical protein